MHIREFYDKKLRALNEGLLEMGQLVGNAIHDAVQALMEADQEKAKAVKKGDDRVNALEIRLEDECTSIIATEAPVASDLRYIITSLKVIANLERMGDHAVHLAKTALKVAKGASGIRALPEFLTMGQIAKEMLEGALKAFVEKDSQLATQIAKRDDEVDELHKGAVKQIFALAKDQTELEPVFALLLASRFLERLGDHITNICEWIIYSNEARHVELND